MASAEPVPATSHPATLARLRFLADVAIDTLGAIDAKAMVGRDSVFRIAPESACEKTLRFLLRLAVSLLVQAEHWELGDQIEKVLREPA